MIAAPLLAEERNLVNRIAEVSIRPTVPLASGSGTATLCCQLPPVGLVRGEVVSITQVLQLRSITDLCRKGLNDL